MSPQSYTTLGCDITEDDDSWQRLVDLLLRPVRLAPRGFEYSLACATTPGEAHGTSRKTMTMWRQRPGGSVTELGFAPIAEFCKAHPNTGQVLARIVQEQSRLERIDAQSGDAATDIDCWTSRDPDTGSGVIAITERLSHPAIKPACVKDLRHK